MTIYEFQIFCDVSSGVGYAPIWEMGGVYPYMGTPQRRGFFGGLKLITPYYFCAFTITIFLTLSCTSILKIPSASRTRVSFLMQLLCGEVKLLRQRYIFAFVIQHVLHHAVVKSVPRTFQQTSRV
jgi:hypothetical protein